MFPKQTMILKILDKDDHEVDAISGATITGDGVTDMINERLQHYLPYFKSADKSCFKPIIRMEKNVS